MRLFGIRTIFVNGTPVFTFCFYWKDTPENREIIKKHGLVPKIIEEKSKLEVEYTSLSYEKFYDKCEKVKAIAREIAQNNFNQKYAWTVPMQEFNPNTLNEPLDNEPAKIYF
ncbi:MAG TPA: hypothetical protein PKD00_00620 [Burkholderiales bacterium]|nr:hypothetical protein [Burkholderiales bacterium]